MLKFLFFMLIMLYINFKNFWKFQFLFLIMFMMFLIYFPSFYNLIYFKLFLDFMSYGLILLSMWIVMLMMMASEKLFYFKNMEFLFIFFLLMLMIFLFLSFSVVNIFMYYIFFEMSLIPTLYFILGWGYQPERLQASLYLLFYTLVASLPLLMGIFFLNFQLSTLMYFSMLKFNYYSMILNFVMMMAFLVKMPMFLVHFWLPKAHVEAPIAGSMILAGVLLKLGGYGILRLFFFFNKMMFLNIIWISLSLLGSFLVSLNCLRQIDFKSLIAYSSVVHMSLLLMAMFNFSLWGILNSYLMMIAHGLCSSGLFCLANISYERLSSRSMLINKGLLNFMPSMTIWWFLLCSINMSAPPSLNLLSEIGLLNSILNWSFYSIFFLMLISFFSAAYCLYLYSFSQHGMLNNLMFSYSLNSLREFLLIFFHWLPLNIFILKSEFFLFWI